MILDLLVYGFIFILLVMIFVQRHFYKNEMERLAKINEQQSKHIVNTRDDHEEEINRLTEIQGGLLDKLDRATDDFMAINTSVKFLFPNSVLDRAEVIQHYSLIDNTSRKYIPAEQKQNKE